MSDRLCSQSSSNKMRFIRFYFLTCSATAKTILDFFTADQLAGTANNLTQNTCTRFYQRAFKTPNLTRQMIKRLIICVFCGGFAIKLFQNFMNTKWAFLSLVGSNKVFLTTSLKLYLEYSIFSIFFSARSNFSYSFSWSLIFVG